MEPDSVHCQRGSAPRHQRNGSTLAADLTATRADKPEVRRELHVWIATEPRRYLVAAVTAIDLGPVRLTLASAGL